MKAIEDVDTRLFSPYEMIPMDVAHVCIHTRLSSIYNTEGKLICYTANPVEV